MTKAENQEVNDKHFDLEKCPVTFAFTLIGGKWKPLLLYYLASGKKRFSELQRLIPTATQQMLTNHLRELEKDGLIARQVYAQVPPKVEYSLTRKGESLRPILEQLVSWGQQHLAS